jgi:ATP-dependent exoDNAse (exonuclease V) beta subunit
LLEPAQEQSFAYGTLIHAWLEQIEWLDGGEPDDAALRAAAGKIASEIGPLAGQLDEPLADFRRMLAQRDTRSILSRPANAAELEVLREREFAIRDGDRLLSGSIDRFVLARRGGQVASADVLDFKTDAIAPGDAAALANKVAFYRPQLEAYCRAVQQLYNLPPECVTGRFVFLCAGKVVALDARD